MKDATGELSTTAIAVVAIAAVGVIFTTLILPGLKTSITSKTKCSQAFNCTTSLTGNMASCFYCVNENCTTTSGISCQVED